MTGPTVLRASDALGWFKIWCERPLMFLTITDDPGRPRIDAAHLLLNGYLTAKPTDKSFERFEIWARKSLPASNAEVWLGEAVLRSSGQDHALAVASLLELLKAYERETQ